MTDLADSEKATFKAAAERRRANGIRLGRIRIDADASQVEAFNIVYEEWLKRWGKEKALDILLRAMASIEARMRDKERANPQQRH